MLVLQFCEKVTELVKQNNYAQLAQFSNEEVTYDHDLSAEYTGEQLAKIKDLVTLLGTVTGHNEILSKYCIILQGLVEQKREGFGTSCSSASRAIGRIQKRIKSSSVGEDSPLENLQAGQYSVPPVNSNGAPTSEAINNWPGNRNGGTDDTLISQPETVAQYLVYSSSVAEQISQEIGATPYDQQVIKTDLPHEKSPQQSVNAVFVWNGNFNLLNYTGARGNVTDSHNTTADSHNTTADGGWKSCLKLYGGQALLIMVVGYLIKIWLQDWIKYAFSFLNPFAYPMPTMPTMLKTLFSNGLSSTTPESVSNARANADGINQNSDAFGCLGDFCMFTNGRNPTNSDTTAGADSNAESNASPSDAGSKAEDGEGPSEAGSNADPGESPLDADSNADAGARPVDTDSNAESGARPVDAGSKAEDGEGPSAAGSKAEDGEGPSDAGSNADPGARPVDADSNAGNHSSEEDDLWKHVTAYFDAIQNYVLDFASGSKNELQRMANGVQVSMGFGVVLACLFALALNPGFMRRNPMLKNAQIGVASAVHHMSNFQRDYAGDTYMDSDDESRVYSKY